MNQSREPISVTELTSIIKTTLEGDPRLMSIYMHGEISNFKIYSSGHAYFSLKDKNAVISANMWQSYVKGLDFMPKDGDEVIVHGKISLYAPRGQYSISVDRMDRYGEGENLRKLRELAEKLAKEGLFAPERKRRLAPYPTHVGVIAGKGSAGLRDIEVNLLRRYPVVQLHVFPSLVQGAEAPKALLEAFHKAQEYPLDTLIIARGGGSSEDLGAFNDEALVRALATSKCPVIAAVGHEVDVTLVDLVADVRVSTPTAAAVAAVPNKDDIRMSMDDALSRLGDALQKKILAYNEKLEMLCKRSFFLHPEVIYQDKKKELVEQSRRMTVSLLHLLERKKVSLSGIEGKLKALHPEGVLERGYALLQDEEGHIQSSIVDISLHEHLTVKLRDGKFQTEVISKEEA